MQDVVVVVVADDKFRNISQGLLCVGVLNLNQRMVQGRQYR